MTEQQEPSLASLRRRVEQLEQQLAAKRPIRVDKVEYKIDKLYVESIDHGILDLGVHLGGQRHPLPADAVPIGQSAPDMAIADFEELDQRLSLLESALETLTEQLDDWKRQVEERLGRLESD